MSVAVGNDVNQVTLGTGTLKLDGVLVGFLKGDVTLALNREVKNFEAGVPLQTRKRVCIREGASLRASLAQMYSDKLLYALGDGVISTPLATTSRLSFGGSSEVDEWTLEFTHNVPNTTSSIVVYFYRASPSIAVEIPFREEDFTVYNAEWGALADDAQPAGEQYGYVDFINF